MKKTICFILFSICSIHSQIEKNWKNFELNSEWKIHYIENDTIDETSNAFGKLIFKSKNYPLTVKFNVFISKPELKTEKNSILKSIIFKENPEVMDEFHFKNNYYKLILSNNLLSRYKIYNSLIIEIENYINKR